MNALHFGGPTKNSGLFAGTCTIVQCSPAHSGPSNCVACRRPIQVSRPCGVLWPSSLGWLKRSPRRELRSNSVPTQTSRKLLTLSLLLACRAQPPPENVRRTFRSCSNRSSTHSTLMSSLDKFASALIGALLGKSPSSSRACATL